MYKMNYEESKIEINNRLGEWDTKNLMEFFANIWSKNYGIVIKTHIQGKNVVLFNNEKTELLCNNEKNIDSNIKNIIVSVLDMSRVFDEDATGNKFTYIDVIIGFQKTNIIHEEEFIPLCNKKICIRKDEHKPEDNVIVFIPITPIFESNIHLVKTDEKEWEETILLKFLANKSRGFDNSYVLKAKAGNDENCDYRVVEILDANICIVKISRAINKIGAIYLFATESDNNMPMQDKDVVLIKQIDPRLIPSNRDCTILVIPIESVCSSKNVMII